VNTHHCLSTTPTDYPKSLQTSTDFTTPPYPHATRFKQQRRKQQRQVHTFSFISRCVVSFLSMSPRLNSVTLLGCRFFADLLIACMAQ
jgi:hypothetical protein